MNLIQKVASSYVHKLKTTPRSKLAFFGLFAPNKTPQEYQREMISLAEDLSKDGGRRINMAFLKAFKRLEESAAKGNRQAAGIADLDFEDSVKQSYFKIKKAIKEVQSGRLNPKAGHRIAMDEWRKSTEILRDIARVTGDARIQKDFENFYR